MLHFTTQTNHHKISLRALILEFKCKITRWVLATKWHVAPTQNLRSHWKIAFGTCFSATLGPSEHVQPFLLANYWLILSILNYLVKFQCIREVLPVKLRSSSDYRSEGSIFIYIIIQEFKTDLSTSWVHLVPEIMCFPWWKIEFWN